MSLLRAPIIESGHIYSVLFFYLSKKRPKVNFSLPKRNFDLSEKIRKAVSK